ncbi:hypothetical protein [Zhihengliuella salsuginis]|uniref:Uncharacterized protein n=1 Tax=Zhihengliuella salsuginis TaxID=578222 RepID=A0ABQ3GD75_9MICC|nr:hypothetical protein [Zhihengliuella salsuginis]GHD01948.1 hypothetical protein GCM10008096_06630 [Zhihengliuella salsuginis]
MSNEGEPALTRRALRERRRAQETAERAESEAAEAHTDEPAAGGVAPGSPTDPEADAAQPEQATADDTVQRVQRANRSRRAAEVPVDAVPERRERSSLQRARDREDLRRRRAAETAPAPAPADDPAPLTRRQLRLQALAAAKSAAGRQEKPATENGGAESAPVGPQGAESPEEAADLDTAPRPVVPPAASGQRVAQGEMSVEEALEEQKKAKPDTAGHDVDGPATEADYPTDDTGLIDLETLAAQREHAARAAIINRRIAERRRLEAENVQRLNQVSSNPFTGSMNQFVGTEAERQLVNTGISGPPTSGVELDFSSRGKSAGRSTEEAEQQAADVAEADYDSADTPGESGPEAGGHRAAGEAGPGGQPLAAVKAQGLDPLDSVTAGIRRANLWLFVSFGALGVGLATFIAGLVMITNSN